MINNGDIALVIDNAGKEHMIVIQAGRKFETHHGFILHDAIIGREWGSIVHSSLGHPYLVVPPSTADLIRHIKRSSQVIFPKDSAYILMRLNIKPGTRVLESGCGSGGLTLALAQAVMPAGRVYSQEIREDFIALTQRNMARVGLEQYVTFIHDDATQGFRVDEPVDAVFIDMPAPQTCLTQARAVLKHGGFFGSLVPTTNQVQDILRGMDAMGQYGFGMIEVEEVILRGYKPVAERLRPRDRMVAHTGYLIFARAVIKPPPVVPSATTEEAAPGTEPTNPPVTDGTLFSADEPASVDDDPQALSADSL
ncbi:MAG: tRNA (adenine-N1)-methyltransferase [Chloroflexi bacterium]|nr:tRNA (adenine-N1)-methyltransferase [Chloroflexota bacterium]